MNRTGISGPDKVFALTVGITLLVTICFIVALQKGWIFKPAAQIPTSVWSPLGQTTAQMDQVEEERKFKEVERVAQTAREAAQKLAPENPPRYWQAEKVIFQTDSVWVILREEESRNLPPSQGQTSAVGLVIHKSHEHYADWLGFAGTAASRSDNRLTTRLFYVGLADAVHPDSPAAYLSPFSSSE